MATEQRRKQNETISGILKLLKSTNYKGGNKKALKSDLMMATEVCKVLYFFLTNLNLLNI